MKPHQRNINQIMIKTKYKKSIYNLGNGINNYDQLIQKIKQRFDKNKQYVIYFNDILIEKANMIQCFKQILLNNSNTIKLNVFQHGEDVNFTTEIKIQSQNGKKQQLVENNEKQTIQEYQKRQENKIMNIGVPQVKTSQAKSKKFSFNPNEFEDQKQQREIHQKEQQRKQKIQQNSSNQTQATKDQKFDVNSIQIQVFIHPQKTSFKQQKDTPYNWQCTLINKGYKQIPKQVYIRDLTTHQLIQLNGFSISKSVEFGPYVQKQYGKHIHLYQLIYKQNQQIRYAVGSKFGFVCEVEKKIDMKELQNKLHERVQNLRSFAACQRSTANLVLKLKQIGIGQQQIQAYDDESLLQIFESFDINE